MLKLSKLADYGIVLLTHMASESADQICTARELAEETGLPLPTASKVLKILARANLVQAQRGTKGGYTLARPASQISVAEMISAVDGPIALTECGNDKTPLCDREGECAVSSNWQRIGLAVQGALQRLSLADMAEPLSLGTDLLTRPVVERGQLPIIRS